MSDITGPISLGEKWTAVIYHDWDLPSKLIEQWETLAQVYGDAGIYLNPGWFEQWWKVFGKPGELFLVVLKEDGDTRAIFPLRKAGVGESKRKRSIVSLTNDHSHYFDFLVNPESRQAAVSKFIALLQKISSYSRVEFNELLSEPCVNSAALEKELKRRGFMLYTYEMPHSPYIELKSSFDEYDNGLQSKFKGNLKRRRRKAEQEGTISFECIKQSPALDDLLSEVFEVEYQSWKGAEGTAIKCLPDVEVFYRRIGKWASGKECLNLFVLRLDARIIAFQFCVESQNTVFLMKTGYNQNEFADYSPGHILQYEIMKYLFDKPKFRKYAFGGACTPWKMEWTSDTNSGKSLIVYPKTLAGFIRYWREYGWKVYLKQFKSLRQFKRWIENRRAETTPRPTNDGSGSPPKVTSKQVTPSARQSQQANPNLQDKH